MHRRFIVDNPAQSRGPRMAVDILNGNRPELLRVLDALGRQPWSGRIIYYDPQCRGSVDFLIETTLAGNGFRCALASSGGGPWSRVGEFPPAEVPLQVQRAFERLPLVQEEKVPRSEGFPAAATRPSPRPFVPPPLPGMQLSLL